MKKVNVLDTCVVAQDPFSFKKVKGNEVIIPIQVLEELDKLKTYGGLVGKHARVFIRELDDLCNKGNLVKGIRLENKALFKVEGWQEKNKDPLMDNKILDCAIRQSKRIGVEVTLYSNDINLRVKARLAGLIAKGFEDEAGSTLDLYPGHITIAHAGIGQELAEKGFLEINKYPELKGLSPNECICFTDGDKKGLALGRKIGNRIKLLQDKSPWGLYSRNKEQAFALDLLTDPKLPLVTLAGMAGTGKTIVTVAAGLDAVLDKKQFSKLVLYRPIQPVGSDIGYLPGDLKEKLMPWMGAIFDSMEYLFENKNNNWKNTLDMYLDRGKIQMEAITHIRGRSIANAFIILDESQNISKEEMKTILTRAGQGSKIVITGDIEQIDRSDLDAMNNGLSYVIDKFKDSDLAGHISFSKGERSPLATKAAELL